MVDTIRRFSIRKSTIVFLIISGLFCIPLIGVSIIIISRNQITPNDEFFAVSIGSSPKIDVSSWRLIIDGHVENPLIFTYENLTVLPAVEVKATLKCVDGLSGTAVWRGVQLKTILDMAKLMPGAIDVVFYAADDYTSSLTVNESSAEEILLAYEMNGEFLPVDQGYPLRVVATNHAGYKWVKWIERIEVVNYDYLGYWETEGWRDSAQLTPINDWSLHAILFSISFLFGGISYLSGLKFATHVKFFKDLPKFFSRKFHLFISMLYLTLSVITFVYWVILTFLTRSEIFFTFHGVISLIVILCLFGALVSGLLAMKRKKKFKGWHARLSLLSLYLYSLSIFLGFLLSFGAGFIGLRMPIFFAPE